MGHGFRFDPEHRYILARTQNGCDLEYPYPKCIKDRVCTYGRRVFCVLWDIFNLNITFLDSEKRKQRKLTEFIGVK